MMHSASSDQSGAFPLGPPCAKFFLRQHEDVSISKTDQAAEDPRRHSRAGTDDSQSLLESLLTGPEARLNACLSGAKVRSVWEITEEGLREVDPTNWSAVSPGAVREALYENAVVDFWVDPEAGKAYIHWFFGPLYARGFTSRIVQTSAGIALHDEELRWES